MNEEERARQLEHQTAIDQQNILYALLTKTEKWSGEDLTTFRQNFKGTAGMTGPYYRVVMDTRLSVESIAAALALDLSVKQLDAGNERLAKTTLRLSRVGIGVGIIAVILTAVQVWLAFHPPAIETKAQPAAQSTMAPVPTQAPPVAAAPPGIAAPSVKSDKADKAAVTKRMGTTKGNLTK